MLRNLDLEQIYEFVSGDEEGEVCDEIPEEACTDVPRNFFINAGNGMATKLADQLANPGLVLPWFLDALGAPASVTGFLTPVRRAGALLPQLVIAGQIRQFQIRKWFWIAGGFLFGLFLILMIPTAYFLPGLTSGIVIVMLLGLGSLSRGVSSVAFKDVLAKTIPKGRRGILLATRATVGGVLALGAGLILRLRIQNQNDIVPFLFLIGLAGILWITGAALVAWISETEGATEGSRNPIQEAQAGLKLLREVPGFRKFVLSRGALLTIELSLPIYALFARRSTGGGASDLGVKENLSSGWSSRNRKTLICGGQQHDHRRIDLVGKWFWFHCRLLRRTNSDPVTGISGIIIHLGLLPATRSEGYEYFEGHYILLANVSKSVPVVYILIHIHPPLILLLFICR